MNNRGHGTRSLRRWVPVLVLGVLGIWIAGCTQAHEEHPGDVQRLLAATHPGHGPRFEPLAESEYVLTFGSTPQPIYRIGPDDVLHIWGDTDFLKGFGETSKGEVVGTRVKPDGQVYLPVLGAVPAQGLTVIELQASIHERLRKYKEQPFVSVDLLEARSQRFYVLGEVNNPGVYPVDGRITLLEGFSRAGGGSPDADLRTAYVVRDRQVLPLSLADVVVHGDTSRNIRMQDGDLVFVPSRKDAQVYVLGEVREPGSVPMADGQVTLMGAVSASGGLLPETADENLIRVFRGGWGNIQCFTLSACELYAVGEDVGLHPGDRVLVAPRQLATFQRSLVLMQPFIQAATTTAITALGVANTAK